MSITPTGRLYDLLPAVYRVRDRDQGEPLRALLAILEKEFAALEDDVAGLYENWFIETCDEWVAPYIADLLGVRGFKPIGGAFTARPYVAHTLGYRRRKGSAAMLEQLARDVTNWPARVVEFFQLLDTTQYLNHLRPANVITPDLRNTNALELLGSPFDQSARTLEVRSPSSNGGRYNVPNLGIFLWRLASFPVSHSTARPVTDGSDGRYRFNPLGHDAPLFNQPGPLDPGSRIAAESQVPGALRRRPLYDDLEAVRHAIVNKRVFHSVYFGANPVLSISVAGTPIPPEKIVICDLSDQPAPPGSWPKPPAAQQYTPSPGGAPVMLPLAASVDPLLGRLAFPAGSIPAAPAQVLVSYSYGFAANLGGGPYDRSDSLPQLAAGQRPWQVAVSQELTADNSLIFSSLNDAISNTVAGWNAQPPGTFGIIAILDSRTYAESLAINIPENSQLLIVAADWAALREGNPRLLTLEPVNVQPHIQGAVQVTGTAAPNSTAPGGFTMNGILLEGSLTVEPGNLGSLQLIHCTLVPQAGGIQVVAHLEASLNELVSFPLRVGTTLTTTATKLQTGLTKLPNGHPPPPPVIRITTTSPLAPAMVGASMSRRFAATGGTGFSWEATGLPSWLTLSAAGILTGTPPVAGPVVFTVTVSNSEDSTRSASFTLPVNPALAIATPSPLPAAVSGVAYSLTLAATGGTGVFTWTAAGLPAGLTLSPAGLLSGTPPAAGSASPTITVTDSAGAAVARTFSLTVNPPLAIATASVLPSATASAAFSQTLAATGGTGVYTWSGTALPTWLTLSKAGVLAGTPPAAGNTAFTATVTDSSGAAKSEGLSLSINPPLEITTTSPLPSATAGTPFTLTLAATGGSGVFTWSIAGQPPWLSLSAAGVLSGTPPSAGTASFTVTLKDSGGASQSVAFVLPLNPPLSIATPSPLPPANLGRAYDQTLTAAGGAGGGFRWFGAGLPPWLTLSANGVLTGTPPALGNLTFNVTVADSSEVTRTGAFALTVVPPPLTITTSQLSGATTNVAYTQTLAGTGGTPPLAWIVSAGALPPGLVLSTAGAITGTPTTVGAFNFTVQLGDSAAGPPAVRPFVITVVSGLNITTAPQLPGVTVSTPYSQTLTAAGGTLPVTWSVSSGVLPAGLVLNPSTGVLAGTPSAIGQFTFTVKVADSAALSGIKAFTLTIAAAPAVALTSPPNGTLGASLSVVLGVAGGTTPFTWSITAGSLPPGISLDPTTGTLSGTPSTAGTFNPTVQVKDASLATATQRLTMVIAPPLSIATAATLPRGTAATLYAQNLATTGGTAPFTWLVSSGTLPAGITLSPAGTLGGTPAAAASANFTAQVTDSAGASATAPFTLTVAPPLVLSTALLPPAEASVPYSSGLAASGGTPPYSWSVTAGALPAGITLSPTGVLGGTPAAAGAFAFTVQVADSNSVTSRQALNLTVAPLLTIVTPSSLAHGEAGSGYSVDIASAGGLPPYRWSVTAGALPPGLQISPAGLTGAIRGVPAAAGTFTFTGTATDTAGVSSSREFTVIIIDNNPILTVTLRRTICGPLSLSAAAQLSIIDSIIDGAGAAAISAPAADAGIQSCTVLGPIGAPGLSGVRTLEASDSIFTGPVFVERRQMGCARFCYVARDSRTPRRYRCQPDLALKDVEDLLLQAAIRARLTPLFTSSVHGLPGYAQLSLSCAAEIRTGAGDGSEMGAFDFIKQPQREDNLRASLEEYLRFGLEAGIFFVS